MLSGYLVGRFRLLPDNGSKVISRFVFLVAMPAFIFISLAGVPIGDFFNWPYLAVLGGGMLAIYLLAMVVGGMEHHFKHIGQRRSFQVFAWTIAIEIALILVGYLLQVV